MTNHFTFVPSKQNYYITKKWSTFIKKCTEKCNQIGIPIDECYLQSIVHQHIYTTYLLKQQETIFHSFDYATVPICISDISFWKVCKLTWNNHTYYYHKRTNAVFQIDKELVWKGIFDFTENKIIYPHDCPNYVVKWFSTVFTPFISG